MHAKSNVCRCQWHQGTCACCHKIGGGTARVIYASKLSRALWLGMFDASLFGEGIALCDIHRRLLIIEYSALGHVQTHKSIRSYQH